MWRDMSAQHAERKDRANSTPSHVHPSAACDTSSVPQRRAGQGAPPPSLSTMLGREHLLHPSVPCWAGSTSSVPQCRAGQGALPRGRRLLAALGDDASCQNILRIGGTLKMALPKLQMPARCKGQASSHSGLHIPTAWGSFAESDAWVPPQGF